MVHEIFADTPESEAWFQAIAKISESDKNRIHIPDADTWRNWLEYVEIPAEDIEEVIATTPSHTSAPELYDVLQRGAASIVNAMGEIDSPARFAALADFNSPQYRFFYVQLLTACLPFVQEYHRSLGIPEDISRASLADLGRNVRVHRKREGIGGLGVMWWLMLHFRGVIYQLGRLQFELQRASKDVISSMRDHEIETRDPMNVLSIHIPDFMGPMDQEACSESIAEAISFFPTYFPDWHVDFAVCNSWLLDPQLRQVLRPTSNIVMFQDRFTLTDGSYDSSESVMQFVFGKHLKDIDTIHPQSSLEKGVLNHLKNGKKWFGREGWFGLQLTSNP